MNYKRFIYWLLSALLLSSCGQEEPTGGGASSADEAEIVFTTSLPGVTTRSTDQTEGTSLNDDGFHVSAICHEDETKIDANGNLSEYFTEQLVTKTEGNAFSSGRCKWPGNRDSKDGHLKFFAFYPSREVMKQSIDEAAESSAHFNLVNHSTKNGSTVRYDYRLAKFRLHKDISRHIDFVTATTEGSKSEHLHSGVHLDFEHQLSRIRLMAWDNSDSYDIEIAGVRIGNAVVESDFNFAGTQANFTEGDITVSGSWMTDAQLQDCVEYIFREGDTVIPIGPEAKSIMGNGGWAMVIPNSHSKWNHTSDAPQSDTGLYFSVLLRVKDKSNMLLYPYSEGAHIYLSVNKDKGTVIKRLYKNVNGYFTDPGFSENSAYTVPETEEVRAYGWAAVPYEATWKAGYEYTYTLDYSKGVGVEDPESPYPGKPIISRIMVDVSKTENGWHVNDFDKEDDIDMTDKITVE